MFQKSSLRQELVIELYGYTLNKKFYPSKNRASILKRRTPIMILRAPKHFKIGKHILQRYTILFKVLFSIRVAPRFLFRLIQNLNKTNFFICRRLLPYTGTYTTIVLTYRIKFKHKTLFNMTGV